jgi:tRNA threonylcarbamoyladenosine biosynthesis protein TsaE
MANPKLKGHEVVTRSPQETEEAGARFVAGLQPGSCVAICGPMGAGKTHFVRGMALGLDCAGPVASPTYALVHEYGRPVALYHLDFYRLKSAGEVESLGWEEICADGAIVVVEWGNKFEEVFPDGTIWVEIEPLAGEGRRIVFRDSI